MRPIKYGGVHCVDNGMLLRSDVHKCSTRVPRRRQPILRLRVSPRLTSESVNGVEFCERARDGHAISMPATASFDPSARP